MLTVLTVLVVLCLVLVIAMLAMWPGRTATENENAGQPAQMANMVSIETPYLTLYYPDRWEAHLLHEHHEEDGVYTESFYCTVGGRLIALFDVHFGDAQAGEVFGYILQDGKKVPFCLTFHDYIPDESWSEEDQFVLFAMQESVNDLVQAVRENEAYSAQ